MEFICQASQLKQAVKIVSSFVPRKSTMPVLSCVLVKAENDLVTIVGTDLEKSARVKLPAQVIQGGVLAVTYSTLAELVASLDGQVKAHDKDYNLIVECGKSHSKVRGMPQDEFPALPEPKGESFLLSGEQLGKVVFAAAADDSHPVLNGLHLESGESLVLAAADGFRLAQITTASVGVVGMVNVPAKALLEVVKQGDVNCYLPDSENAPVFFETDNVTISSQLIPGNFPEVARIIPQESKTKVTVDRVAFLNACKLARIFSKGVANIVRINIEDTMTVVGAAQDGEGNTELEIAKTGSGLMTAFNVNYLVDALNVMDSTTVELGFNDPTKPLKMTMPGNGEFVYVVMPMHV